MRSTNYPSARATKAYLHRALKPERDWAQHDWRQSLIPAAIKAGLPNSCLRVCAAICSRQRGRDWYPYVAIGLEELSALAGWKPYRGKAGKPEQNHGNVRRAIRRLVKAGLLTVEPGFGKLPDKSKRKADRYRLGTCLRVSEPTPLRVSEPTPRLALTQDRGGVEIDTLRPYLSPTEREGDRGEMTVALTGDPTPTNLSPQPISSSRIRDLLERFRPTNKELR